MSNQALRLNLAKSVADLRLEIVLEEMQKMADLHSGTQTISFDWTKEGDLDG